MQTYFRSSLRGRTESLNLMPTPRPYPYLAKRDYDNSCKRLGRNLRRFESEIAARGSVRAGRTEASWWQPLVMKISPPPWLDLDLLAKFMRCDSEPQRAAHEERASRGGQNKKVEPCPWCGCAFGARQMKKHYSVCMKRPTGSVRPDWAKRRARGAGEPKPVKTR